MIGATLLLVLPSSAFDAIVPALIALALVLVVAQPRLDASARRRRHPDGQRTARRPRRGRASGVYGGYFGAGQGILLMGILGIAIDDTLQRLNGLKNVLAGLVNLTAGLIFVFAADVDWGVAGLIAAGSIIGGVRRRALRAPALADGPAGADRDRRHSSRSSACSSTDGRSGRGEQPAKGVAEAVRAVVAPEAAPRARRTRDTAIDTVG